MLSTIMRYIVVIKGITFFVDNFQTTPFLDRIHIHRAIFIFLVEVEIPACSCLTFEFPCPSVLDLNAFERQNKAEGLGMVTEEGSSKLKHVLIVIPPTSPSKGYFLSQMFFLSFLV